MPNGPPARATERGDADARCRMRADAGACQKRSATNHNFCVQIRRMARSGKVNGWLKRGEAPAAAPRIETESQPLPDVAARAVPAAAGDPRGADPQNGGETEPAGEFRSDYFSDLHARVVAVLDYPPRAKNERVEGTVVVRVRIDRDGRIQSSQVAESSGSRVLDRHALRVTKRAAPFGPVPAHFEADDLAFELPVEFALRD